MLSIVKELRSRNRKDFSPSALLASPIGSDGAVSFTSPAALAVPGSINEQERSHSFVIVDMAEDREGDVIHPDGCLDTLEDYKKNPVVLYEHNAELGAIGKASHPQRGFSVDVQPTKIIAKCFFHCLPFRGQNLSAECWELVRQGVLLGASVGFLPLESQRRGYGKGLEFLSWRLTEFSVTFLPVNAKTLSEDVLRNSLSRGKIKSIQLRQRIESILPPAKVWSPGAEIKSMSKKPQVVAVELSTDDYTPELAARFLKTKGYGFCTEREDFPGLMIFSRPGYETLAGSQKSLAKGAVALLGKKKAMNDDEDEEKDDYTENPDAEADAAETHDEPDGDETATGDEPETPETDEADTETEATDDADVSEETAAQARDLVNVIVHFESLLEALPGMAQHPELSDKYAKIQADAESLVADLNEAFKEKFADHAIEQLKQSAMAGDVDTTVDTAVDAPVEDVPVEDVDEDTPDMDEDEIKKALTKARREAGRVKSGMVRLAKAFSGVA